MIHQHPTDQGNHSCGEDEKAEGDIPANTTPRADRGRTDDGLLQALANFGTTALIAI
jgi:hypothetical protein